MSVSSVAVYKTCILPSEFSSHRTADVDFSLSIAISSFASRMLAVGASASVARALPFPFDDAFSGARFDSWVGLAVRCLVRLFFGTGRFPAGFCPVPDGSALFGSLSVDSRGRFLSERIL